MQKNCDVIVVGGGGAGLTAALYTARAELSTVVFERNITGGQIAITDMVENFPGFVEGVTGGEIAAKMEEQAKKYGAEIVFEEVDSVTPNGSEFHVVAQGETYTSKAVILALGAHARMLDAPGEKEYIGKGVSYCATCDAPFFRNKVVAVIGGGDSALQEALFLTKFAKKVYIVHRRNEFRAGVILQERVKTNDKIEVVWDSVVTRVIGKTMVTGIQLRNVKTEQISECVLDGVFVFIGHVPSSQVVKKLVHCDESGYIITNERMETSQRGIFACGEVRKNAVWQLVASCGEGCQAALHAQKYIEDIE